MTAPIQHQTHEPDPGTDPGTGTRAALSYLRLTGASDDGTQLRLVDEEGAEHVLAVDDRLRQAVQPPAPAAPTRGMEKTMESMLRPRDIQARIRAGETPEAVAQAAQTSVDKIMAFAAPVLAEREHIAQRAQRSSVRRSDGAAPTGARTLGDAVASHLRGLNIDPATVTWDAWRREDGRWTLTGDYALSQRTGAASFTFDAPGNYVTLDNDDARWLVGETIAAPPAPARADDLQAARERRLSAVAEDELPLGDILDDTPDGTPDDASGDILGEDAIDLVTEQPVEAFLDDSAPTDPEVEREEAELREEAAEAAAAEPDPAAAPEQAPEQTPEPPARRPAKKRGRASVPSWDEIMFGGGDQS